MSELPTRSEVAAIIDRLVGGELSREAASRWACRFLDETIVDEVVDDALDWLLGIDLLQFDAATRPIGYLHGIDQLSEVRRQLG